jgi:hypothetical protein
VEDCGVGDVLVGCVCAGFDVGYLLDDVLGLMLADGGVGWEGRMYSSLC